MAPVKQFAKENKMVSVLAAVIASGLIGWGAWVTVASFDNKEKIAVQMEKVSTLCVDIDTIQKDVTSIKKSQTELNSTVISNQMIIMNDLKALRKGK